MIKEQKILEVKNLSKHYQLGTSFFNFNRSYFKALENVSFSITKGETLGVVGESGCGKSTLGRSVLKLEEISSGQIFFKSQEITHLNFSKMRQVRPQMQMIFQRALFS